MKTIGANHQIKPAIISAFELNLHTIRVILKVDNSIAENDVRRIFDPLKQQP